MEIDQKHKFRIIAIVVAIIIAGAGLILLVNSLGSEKKQQPYFSKLELKDKKITAEENTLLKTQVSNPLDRAYENVKIQLITKCQKIRMNLTSPGAEVDYENTRLGKDEFEQRLSVDLPYGLMKEAETGVFTFDISGGIYSGVDSMDTILKAQIVLDGEVIDNKVLKLTINAEE